MEVDLQQKKQNTNLEQRIPQLGDKIAIDWWTWITPVFLTAFLALVSLQNFLLFHTYAELFSIIVAIILSVVAWYTYDFSKNHFLMFLGLGYFWIAVLNLLHTLTFKGVNIIAGSDANMGIQFWIVARYLEASLLLIAPYFLNHRVTKISMFTVFGVGSVIVYWVIVAGYFPQLYIEGMGLTHFKIISEYLIIGMLSLAIIIMVYYRDLMGKIITRLLVLSVLFTVLAEICFTLYVHVESVPIFVGHIFKMFSYWFIFVAVVRTTLTEPYQIMARGFSTYDAVPDATIVVDKDGIIRQVNRAACADVGSSPGKIIDRHCHDLFHPENILLEDCPVCEQIEKRETLHNLELHFPKEDRWRAFTLTPIEAPGNLTGMVHVSSDVTVRKKAEEELIYQASYDPLTNLPNRALATDRLTMLIKRARHEKKCTAVMFADIDNFKDINDTLGHGFGDRILVEVAKRIAESIRESDTVARWGGDEFIIIVTDLTNLMDAEYVAEQVLEKFSRPFVLDRREFNISISLGISGYPEDGERPDVLLSHADAAMYKAKTSGKNTFRFFTSDMNEYAARKMLMESHLRHAIERDEFELCYQPVLNLNTMQVTGCEALLCWHNTSLGKVVPDVFIPLAEESGMIVPIGRWVLERACADLAVLRGMGYAQLNMSVNISSRQLREPEFLNMLNTILVGADTPAENIVLEITESLLLEAEHENVTLLSDIVKSGVRLSLDDFGTGYSSLSYLKRFPFSEVKIDRSFVMDITENPSDAALCKAIVAMAESLDLIVVGEGVETSEQMNILKESRAHMAQGFYFSRPVPFEQLVDFLRTH
ncbi:MAG: EAL domain-containing protein [Gammaproteobacteria bacterium]|nr:EAL domain-containing protein [Gammaproteobacteria bacterium]